MSSLLGPILAQLVTLGVADRTEARYVAPVDKHFEASTSPRVGLAVDWKHSTLTLGYGPSFTVVPLESTPREVLIFQGAAIGLSYHLQRTTITALQSFGYGRVNFQVQALAGGAAGVTPMTGMTMTPPTTGPGTTTPPTQTGTTGGTTTTPTQTTGSPTANQIGAFNQAFTFINSSTTLNVTQMFSPILSVSGGVNYTVSGSVGHDASSNYPLIGAPGAYASASYRVTRDDDVASTLSMFYVSANHNEAFSTMANESWAHKLDSYTGTRFGAGLSLTRNAQSDGLVSYTIYPVFNASIGHVTTLARGGLSFSFGASAAPVLDPIRAAVNPGLGINGSVGWGKDRFAMSLAVGSAVSLSGENPNGGLNSFFGVYTLGFRLGAGFFIDTGVRGFWQSFEGTTTVPPSYAAFLGLTFAAAVPLGR